MSILLVMIGKILDIIGGAFHPLLDPSEQSQQDRFETQEPGGRPPNRLDIAADNEKVKNWAAEISLGKGKDEEQIKDLIHQITEFPVSERDPVMQFVQAVSKDKMGWVSNISSIVSNLKKISTVDRDFIMMMTQRLSVNLSHISDVNNIINKVKEFNKRGLDINASKQIETLCEKRFKYPIEIIDFFKKISLLNFAERDHLICLAQKISHGRDGDLKQIIDLIEVIQRIEPSRRDKVIGQAQDAMSGQNSSVEDIRKLIFRIAMTPVDHHDDILFEVQPTNAEAASATKIQSLTRGWQYRQRAKSLSQDRKRLFTQMTTVNKIIKESTSAQIVNQEEIDRDTNSEIKKIRELDAKKYITKIIREGIGNCGETANLLFILISYDSKISEETKKQLHLCQLPSPENHVFVVVGDPSDDNCLVIDPWIKYLDLLPLKGYRPQPVSANSMSRKRGFFGSKRQYLKFLDTHADGTYVIREQPHQFVVTPAPKGNFRQIMKYSKLRSTT